jgi:hypothetical protein
MDTILHVEQEDIPRSRRNGQRRGGCGLQGEIGFQQPSQVACTKYPSMADGRYCRSNRKVARISSRDSASGHVGEAVDRSAALTGYDARNEFAKRIEGVQVEKLVVLGLVKPKSVRVENGKQLELEFVAGLSAGQKKDGVGSVLTIKDPGVGIARDWDIIIQL